MKNVWIIIIAICVINVGTNADSGPSSKAWMEYNPKHYREKILEYGKCTPTMLHELLEHFSKESGVPIEEWYDEDYIIMNSIRHILGCVVPARNVAAAEIIRDYGWGKYINMCLNPNPGDSEEKHEAKVLNIITGGKPDEVNHSTMENLKEVIHIHCRTLKQRFRGKGLPSVLYSELFHANTTWEQADLIDLRPELNRMKYLHAEGDIFDLARADDEVQEALAHWLSEQQAILEPVAGDKSPRPVDFDDYMAKHPELVLNSVLKHEYVVITARSNKLSVEAITDLFEMILNRFPADGITITKYQITVFYNAKKEKK